MGYTFFMELLICCICRKIHMRLNCEDGFRAWVFDNLQEYSNNENRKWHRVLYPVAYFRAIKISPPSVVSFWVAIIFFRLESQYFENQGYDVYYQMTKVKQYIYHKHHLLVFKDFGGILIFLRFKKKSSFAGSNKKDRQYIGATKKQIENSLCFDNADSIVFLIC